MLDSSFTRRALPAARTIAQPSGTVMECLPSFKDWEAELRALGNDGIISRASTFARMSGTELLEQRNGLMQRIEVAHASVAQLTRDIQSMGHQMSEVSLLLSLQRTFETRRLHPTQQPAQSAPTTCIPDDSNVAPVADEETDVATADGLGRDWYVLS